MENYLLVTNDIMFTILLLIMIHFEYAAKVVDVNTIFLCGWLGEEICMECHPGIKNISKDDCIIFQRCICLIKAARQYVIKTVEILRKVGFTSRNVGPCL